MANPLANWGLKKTPTAAPVKETKGHTALFVDPHTQQTYIYTSTLLVEGGLIEVDTRKGRKCCQVVSYLTSNDNGYGHTYKVYLSLIDEDDFLILMRGGRT
jgi:hypothetical protein